MAAKPLTSEAIALTEKKMAMTLDEIIKMSKKPATRVNKRRASNKSQKSFNGAPNQSNDAPNQGKSSMIKRFMDSRSSLRQEALARRRTNFQENQFRVTTATAWKASSAPIRNRPFNRVGQVNFNTPRVGVHPIQRRPIQRRVNAAVAGKVKRQNQPAKTLPMKKPQTLDSLFANMKEQRMMRVQQNLTENVPQARQKGRMGRFGNFTN